VRVPIDLIRNNRPLLMALSRSPVIVNEESWPSRRRRRVKNSRLL
jgi:hypothetical protein